MNVDRKNQKDISISTKECGKLIIHGTKTEVCKRNATKQEQLVDFGKMKQINVPEKMSRNNGGPVDESDSESASEVRDDSICCKISDVACICLTFPADKCSSRCILLF